MQSKKILFFSGNRAEFGYLLPFFIELAPYHRIDFIVSGTHLLPPWNTLEEIERSIQEHALCINIYKIEIAQGDNAHIDSFSLIHDKTVQLLRRNHYDYSFVLGDRPESFAFASAVFLHNTPLIHYAGGDVTDNAYLDSNIRHVITKMAHLHLTLSEDAKNIVQQLGEESWRVKNVGISTYDYERLALLPTKEALSKEFAPFKSSDTLLILTYHATQYKSRQENLQDFKKLLTIIQNLHYNTIITYPNNDTGSQEMISYLEQHTFESNAKVVKNLGTHTLLALYKDFRSVVIGNSSSGLLETALYTTPTLNIGDRQGNRKRADNVVDTPLEENILTQKLSYIITNYQSIKQNAHKNRGIFGFGKSSTFLKELIENPSLSHQKLMFKKFCYNEL